MLQRDIKLKMADGVSLMMDVLLPEGEGPFPAVLLRTPYNRMSCIGLGNAFVKKQIALVVQDVRGRYESEGEFYPFANEYEDGVETLKWLKAQPWSNGKVAMFGDSYLAHVQFALMRRESLAFATLNPRFMCGDGFEHGYYCGGIFNLALTWSWLCFECSSSCSKAALIPHLKDLLKLLKTQPVSNLDIASGSMAPIKAFRDFAEHNCDSEFWDSCNLRRQNSVIDYPVLLTGGWYDFYAGETIKNFKYIKEHSISDEIASQHRMVIGPWTHGIGTLTGIGDIDFGDDAHAQDNHSLEWITGILQGIPVEKIMPAQIKIFVMGSNEWRDEWEWPPKGVGEREYFLHPGHVLSMNKPEIDSSSEELIFDWDNPVPTLGGNHSIGRYNPGLFDYVKPGPFDQSELEKRDDVLSFTTPVMEKDLELIGDVHFTLYASSDAIDCDWFAKIVDVYPDGKAINVTEGCLRGSFGNRGDLLPGKVYQFEFDLGSTAIVFKRGHAIRLDICCSNFPLFELNSAALQKENRTVTRQKIFFGRQYPSKLNLKIRM